MRSYYMNNVVTGALRGPFSGDEEKEYAYPWVVEETEMQRYTPEVVEDFGYMLDNLQKEWKSANSDTRRRAVIGRVRDRLDSMLPRVATPAAKPQLKEQSPPRAQDILATAAEHMMDRAATYDQPQGERSIGKTVSMFNTLTEHGLTEEQGWLFMTCLKMVRAQAGRYRADSYEDGAAYFALAGESAAQERV